MMARVNPLIWAFAGFIVIMNATLFVALPSFFAVDLAKGIYAEGKNFNVTRVYEQAIPFYEEVIRDHPNSAYHTLARLGLASAYRGLADRPNDADKPGNYARALEIYDGLLADLEGESLAEYEYEILSNQADIHRAIEDLDSFGVVLAVLRERYPDSAAVTEGEQFLAIDAARNAEVDVAALADLPVFVTLDDIKVPDAIKAGEEDTFVITVRRKPDARFDFTLQTDLAFWKGFDLLSVEPNPDNASEFWGKRAWSYSLSEGESFDVMLKVRAKGPGAYVMDVDLEVLFESYELGLNKTVVVEE